MGIARVIGISPFLVALVVHSANAEDFGADLRKADVTDQRIYQAATNGGSPSAMYALGVMCDEESDATAAFRWYELAAGHGHAESICKRETHMKTVADRPRDEVIDLARSNLWR